MLEICIQTSYDQSVQLILKSYLPVVYDTPLIDNLYILDFGSKRADQILPEVYGTILNGYYLNLFTWMNTYIIVLKTSYSFNKTSPVCIIDFLFFLEDMVLWICLPITFLHPD
jgi:hypothetical protein